MKYYNAPGYVYSMVSCRIAIIIISTFLPSKASYCMLFSLSLDGLSWGDLSPQPGPSWGDLNLQPGPSWVDFNPLPWHSRP